MDEKPAHHKQVQRLNRARGQVEAVARMIHEGRDSAQILTQLRAARSALRAVEIGILGEHIRHCIKTEYAPRPDSSEQQIKRIDEMLNLLKRYGL